MQELAARVRNWTTGEPDSGCACSSSFENQRLLVDADDCPEGGVLSSAPGCRATVVDALTDRDVETVVVRSNGIERAYDGDAAALLVAAGRFVERVSFHDDALAERARRDPLRAARQAVGRAGPVSDIAAETGLAEAVRFGDGYEDVLRPYVGPTVARSRVVRRPPSDASLEERYELPTGATVRVYDRPDEELRTYHLEPPELALTAGEQRTLADAYELLATGQVSGGERAAGRAVREVAAPDDPVGLLEVTLRKHTGEYGVLEDFFADSTVSDVFATAPVDANRLRVVADGETMRTNVLLTERGTAALASQFRRTSGRAFSRANPTLDAVADAGSEADGVRIAGVTEPVSDGLAFAFRANDADAWTLPALVANGTLPADAAALLSLAVERDAAGLVAGSRGAGKTTLLGALLWELPAATRTVSIEDTPELPVETLQRHERDVQRLRTSTGGDEPGLPPTDALRTALRLGEGALVVGEVRGEEASVLYEAMRVGASGSAVLGTIHGDGGDAVRERVVTDLGVPESSFGATDVVVTVESYESADGRQRRLKAVEEVVAGDEGVWFESLYELADETAASTGRIERGNSHLVERLTRSSETYADVRDALSARTKLFETLATEGRTGPSDVVRAHAARRTGDGSC